MMKYRNIPFMKFAFGLLVVALPAIIMSELGWNDWLWAYVLLILVMFLVFNYSGIEKFATFVRSV